jgi:hypothetical protein
MRGKRDELTGRERQRLTAARDRFERAREDYDGLLVELVDRRGAGAVSRALGVSLQTVHERAKRLRGGPR